MVDYNPKSWFSQLFAIHGSIAPKIILRIILAALWSAAIVLVHRKVHPVGIPSIVHTLVGLALGLLLVFRTNASYERFWEGRKAWGRIVNDSRNVARASRCLFEPQPHVLEALLLWTATFPYAAMHWLRNARGLGPLEKRLPPAAVADVLASTHLPTAVASQISLLLMSKRRDGTYAERVIVYIDTMVSSLVNQAGECERIQKTPLPFAYVVHLRRALVLYLATMPFVLVDAFGWLTILCMLLISYILLGIEEIGVEIENPFGSDHNDLPIEELCATIERDVLGVAPRLPPSGPAA